MLERISVIIDVKKSGSIYLNARYGQRILQHEIVLSLNLNLFLGFRWGWDIDRHRTFPSTDKAVFINESVYVSQPFLRRHITHFAESINQILLKFEYPSFYPKLNTLFLPGFVESSEYEWSREYLKLVLSHIPESQQPAVYTKDKNPFIPKDWRIEYMCFSNVVLFLEFQIMHRFFSIVLHIIMMEVYSVGSFHKI